MEEKKFDANSIIGFLLLGAIMLWFMYTNKPEEQSEAIQNIEKIVSTPDLDAINQAETQTNPISDSIEV